MATPNGARSIPISILHIDDDADFRLGIRAGLERARFEVLEAENGKVGLERCRDALPSLILLDLQMPVLDGWEFLKAKDGDARIAAIPVVVLSSLDAPVGTSSVVRQLKKSTPTNALISVLQLAVDSARIRS
ncbi:MAG: response regulator [Deltaproteobacteria bacterium]|nr:response regulator [Deltaproteobacteria bacterium]